MDNEALKQAFMTLQAKITDEVHPDSVIDQLFANEIISAEHCKDLWDVPDPKTRCGEFIALLHHSSHPAAFIQLRLALLNDYPGIVNEIDKQLTSQTTLQQQQQQQQQLDMSQITEGKFLVILSSAHALPLTLVCWQKTVAPLPGSVHSGVTKVVQGGGAGRSGCHHNESLNIFADAFQQNTGHWEPSMACVNRMLVTINH